jgi:hypothetical protein
MELQCHPAQFFECAHKDMVCVRVFINMSTHTCTCVSTSIL